jgi:hypothetical protein
VCGCEPERHSCTGNRLAEFLLSRRELSDSSENQTRFFVQGCAFQWGQERRRVCESMYLCMCACGVCILSCSVSQGLYPSKFPGLH